MLRKERILNEKTIFFYLVLIIGIFSIGIKSQLFDRKVANEEKIIEYNKINETHNINEPEIVLDENYVSLENTYNIEEEIIAELESIEDIEASILTKEEIELKLLQEFGEDNNVKTSEEYVKKEILLKRENDIAELVKYSVKEGDTLSQIAERFGNELSILKYNNKELKNYIYPEQKLNIATINGMYYSIKKGDALSIISNKYKVSIEDIKKYNNLKNDDIIIGQKIFLKSPNLENLNAQYTFIMPLKNYRGITSEFGERFHPVLKKDILHVGTDFRSNLEPVLAARNGIITFAGTLNGYGKVVIIKHNNGYETRYAHLNSIFVDKGEKVLQGIEIGKSGQTGRVTGPHLHFEVRHNGVAKDPIEYLKKYIS